MKTREVLSRLISFDTVSRNPNMELMEYISGTLSQAGIESTLIPNNAGTKANLYATVGSQNVPGIMLSGHTDVVPIDGQNWTKPAFELTEEDGRYYGRGTTDMKGFVASAMAMAIRASREELKVPLHLAFSYDEELGCLGIPSLIDMLADAPVKPVLCIVGEPTNLSAATGHKGKVALRAVCTGKEGHSALAPFALNALHLGCDLINVLRDMQKEMQERGQKDDDYDVPYTTLHAGKINGGVALNIVPNQCVVDFEIRNITEDDPQEIIAEIKNRLSKILDEARKQANEADITFENLYSYPGLNTPASSDAVAFVKSLTGSNHTSKVAFGTEGGLFSERLGIPTVICGPGSMAQGHKPDEYIEIEQMDRCDAMLENLLEKLKTGL